MSLTAATDDDATDDGQQTDRGFYALLAPEGVWSSDGRMFAPDSLAVRVGPNELPLMGLIENTEAHDRAVNVGHFTEVTRRNDGWWEGYGVWADSPEANEIRARVRAGDVTGVSIDAAVLPEDAEYLTEAATYDEMVAEMESLMGDEDYEPPEPERVTIDGVEYIKQQMGQERMRATAAELMGATIVPFPAFGGATITDLEADLPDEIDGSDVPPVSDDVDSPSSDDAPVAVTAAAAPVAPPRDWFELPGGHTAAYDVVIEDDGRVHGYPAATWDTCHMSFPDECVTPPRSVTDYAYFRCGSVRCDDGSRVRTGPLTLRGGHADRSWSAQQAMAHYDDTDSAFADVNIGEDEHGIWIAGALRPGASVEDVRTAMASGFSGDWRAVGGSHELIALSAVNTRGFVNHASLYESEGLVASMILDMARSDSDEVADADAVLASAVRRIAASIGRTPEQRIEELRGRVHPQLTEVH